MQIWELQNRIKKIDDRNDSNRKCLKVTIIAKKWWQKELLFKRNFFKIIIVPQEKVLKAESEFQERELQKMERERELAVLKRQHEREIYMLKRKLHESAITPKSPLTSPNSSTIECPDMVRIAIPTFILSGVGSTSHVEYQVVINALDAQWTVMRRFRQFRDLHMAMTNVYGPLITGNFILLLFNRELKLLVLLNLCIFLLLFFLFTIFLQFA